jgi:hypothetical protein
MGDLLLGDARFIAKSDDFMEITEGYVCYCLGFRPNEFCHSEGNSIVCGCRNVFCY